MLSETYFILSNSIIYIITQHCTFKCAAMLTFTGSICFSDGRNREV